MSKIILDSEPDGLFDVCPFMNSNKKCKLSEHNECFCIGGYYDSRTFDFDECPFCTTLNKINNE